MKRTPKYYSDPEFRIDFIGIGVAKSGSTWLADKLRLHPKIFIPKEKSVYYFNRVINKFSGDPNRNFGKPLEWYHSFFSDAKPGQIIGEITPKYLIEENCAPEIKRYNPDVKILATLRNPVQRAYSEYLFRVQTGLSRLPSFEKALEDFPVLMETGLYYRHLRRYFDLFPGRNLRVMFYEDLKMDPEGFYREVLEFLGAETILPEGLLTKTNVTMEARSRRVARLMSSADLFVQHRPSLRFIRSFIDNAGIRKISKAVSRMNKRAILEKPRLSPETEKRLIAYFRDDIEKLEKLLGKDLSVWK
jgi:hypothetical protein